MFSTCFFSFCFFPDWRGSRANSEQGPRRTGTRANRAGRTGTRANRDPGEQGPRRTSGPGEQGRANRARRTGTRANRDSFPALSYPVLSCLVLYCPVLWCPACPALSCLLLAYPIRPSFHASSTSTSHQTTPTNKTHLRGGKKPMQGKGRPRGKRG